MWTVLFLPEAEQDASALPPRERVALANAVVKLAAIGPLLPFPHQSAIKGASGLRELRPRGGRSPWRAFYRQLGELFVIAAIGPEAQANPRGFERAIREAVARLDTIDEEGEAT